MRTKNNLILSSFIYHTKTLKNFVGGLKRSLHRHNETISDVKKPTEKNETRWIYCVFLERNGVARDFRRRVTANSAGTQELTDAAEFTIWDVHFGLAAWRRNMAFIIGVSILSCIVVAMKGSYFWKWNAKIYILVLWEF